MQTVPSTGIPSKVYMSDNSRVWLFTGVTSGIGRAAIDKVIAAGEHIAGTTRSAAPLQDLIKKYGPEKLLIVEFDIANDLDVESLFAKVHAHFGRIDVAVNNAGYGLSGEVEAITEEQARTQMEVNFWAPTCLSRQAVIHFRTHKTPAGRILNVSSTGGFRANLLLLFYSASKFAMEGYSKALSKELPAEWNIKIIVIQPGGFRTEWNKSGMKSLPPPPKYAHAMSPTMQFRPYLAGAEYIGDASKAVQAMITVSKAPNPPAKLPLGMDCVWLVETKIGELKRDLEQWKELSLSTQADDCDMGYLAKLFPLSTNFGGTA